MSEAVVSPNPYKKPEPLTVRGNQLTTSAVNSTWHTKAKHEENQFCITWHSLMQLINNIGKKTLSHQVESCFQHLGQAEIVVFLPLLYASPH